MSMCPNVPMCLKMIYSKREKYTLYLQKEVQTIMEQPIGKTVLPFKIQQLVNVIIQKKRCSVEEAFRYLYSSNLHKQLTAESSFLWQFSTMSLYDLLKKEKLAKKQSQNADPKVLLFQVFCLENYKSHKAISADDVLHLFFKYNVFDYLNNVFEMLHTQGRDYIMAEIDEYIKNKKRSL